MTVIAHARLRIVLGAEIAFGPGKADLLALIAETGSIAEAGRRMRMSYKRAWSLVETMNRCFREPLVIPHRGGSTGGGAALTPTGIEVLRRYREMEARVDRAIAPEVAALAALAAPPAAKG